MESQRAELEAQRQDLQRKLRDLQSANAEEQARLKAQYQVHYATHVSSCSSIGSETCTLQSIFTASSLGLMTVHDQ